MRVYKYSEYWSGASEIRKETRSERENGKATATIIISGPHPEENPLSAGECEGEQSEGTTTTTTNVLNEGWIDDEGETTKKKNRTWKRVGRRYRYRFDTMGLIWGKFKDLLILCTYHRQIHPESGFCKRKLWNVNTCAGWNKCAIHVVVFVQTNYCPPVVIKIHSAE